jgi:hypothetical protein
MSQVTNQISVTNVISATSAATGSVDLFPSRQMRPWACAGTAVLLGSLNALDDTSRGAEQGLCAQWAKVVQVPI